jgi:hypothetical protein
MKSAIFSLGIFFVAIAAVKAVYALLLYLNERRCK